MCSGFIVERRGYIYINNEKTRAESKANGGNKMSNQFAMDKEVLKQLEIIKKLQKRSQAAVYSLYAQAVLEYSLYYTQKNQLLEAIDESLASKDKERFMTLTNEYKILKEEYKSGKTIYDYGFKLHLTFQ